MSEKHPIWNALLQRAEHRKKPILKSGPWCETEFLHAIPPLERHAQVLARLNYQVCNGGFRQWVGNGFHKQEPILKRALRFVGGARAETTLKLLFELEDLAIDYDHEELDALDAAYYDVNDALMVDVELALKTAFIEGLN